MKRLVLETEEDLLKFSEVSHDLKCHRQQIYRWIMMLQGGQS